MAKIAVEQPFHDVKQALEENGHQVDMFESDEELEGYDMGVIRNLNDTNIDNFKFPVVSVEGNSVQDIVDDIEKRLHR